MAAIGSDTGISRSEVSRICQGLDEQIQAFLERPLDGCRYPYLYLDATYLHGRLGNSCGEGCAYKVGASESEPFWREFLASLKQRGLTGVRSDQGSRASGFTPRKRTQAFFTAFWIKLGSRWSRPSLPVAASFQRFCHRRAGRNGSEIDE